MPTAQETAVANLRERGFDQVTLESHTRKETLPRTVGHEVMIRVLAGAVRLELENPLELVTLAPGQEFTVADGRPYVLKGGENGSIYMRAARQADSHNRQ